MNNEEQITELEIDLLEANPLQPRGLITPESLAELIESIREHGVLEPLVVAKTPAGYQIIAGERRWRAAKIAGLTKVPVAIKETTPQGMLEMALVENVQRIDLNPIERGQAYQRLMDEFGLSNQEIAKRVSKSPAFISNSIRLLNLPDAIKDALLSGATTEGHARALVALEDPQLIVEGYKIVLAKNLSVRGAEELARKLKAKANIPPKTKRDQARIHSDELEKMQEELEQKFTSWNIKPKVKITQSRVQVRMTVLLGADMETTSDALNKIKKALLSS